MMYCALLFQIITYWSGETLRADMKVSEARAIFAVRELNYVSAKYGHEVVTWGASMKKCVPVPAADQLEILSYFIDFDGDGKVCR